MLAVLYFTDDSQIKEIDRCWCASSCWDTLANSRGNFEYIRRFSVESRRHGLALRISTDIWFPFSRACCICVRDFEAVNSHLFLYSFIDWFFIIFFHFNKIVKIIDGIKFGKASYIQIYLCYVYNLITISIEGIAYIETSIDKSMGIQSNRGYYLVCYTLDMLSISDFCKNIWNYYTNSVYIGFGPS